MPSKANTSLTSTPKSAKRKAATPQSVALNATIPKSAPAKTVSRSCLTSTRSNTYRARYLNPDLDLHRLFEIINDDLFQNRIQLASLRWSMRMTSSAGITTYRGKNDGVDIALSKPILSLRHRVDTVETLIHEMIHAYIFIVYGTKAEKEEHGPKYLKMQADINEKTGFNISVRHDFDDEADYLLTASGKRYLAALKDL